MKKLSPAAEAVMDAFWTPVHKVGEDVEFDRHQAAAALRAAANQAENVHPAQPFTEWGEGWLEGVKDVVAGFRRIADELEGH